MHDIEFQVLQVPTGRLRLNPRNKPIHQDFDAIGRDAWLVADIRNHGILTPLMVGPDGTIADGHRRLAVAQLIGFTHVPCLLLQSAEDDAFHSAQLARSMTLFAKCVLYRDHINNLLKRGQAISVSQLRMRQTTAEADSEALDRDWAQCVEVLNVSRRSLSRGVGLLDAIDAMSAGADPAEMDRARRIWNLFRNRGLRPALRMIGEREPESDDMEPDCGDWCAAEDNEQPSSVRMYARKSAAELREAWLRAALDHLRRFEKLAARHDVLTPRMGKALDELRQGVERQPRRAA